MYDPQRQPPTLDILAVNNIVKSVSPSTHPFPSEVNLDHCVFSFATAESPHGIFLSLESNHSLSLPYLKPTSSFYIQVVKTRVPTPETIPSTGESTPEPKRLAIGVEGGFDGRGYTEQTQYNIACFDKNILYHCPLEAIENEHIQSLVNHVIALTVVDKDAITAWEGDLRNECPELKNLVQSAANGPWADNWLDVKTAKCFMCDKCDNLWLNLGTGFVGCGRKYFDGSGGNNHAIEHYWVVF